MTLLEGILYIVAYAATLWFLLEPSDPSGRRRY